MQSEELLETASAAIDEVIASSDPYNGLFPSLLDRHTGEMLRDLPDCIYGQRSQDRCHLGSNLTHDEPLLKTMYALAEAEGKSHYADAADRYLEYFATNCTATETGLFPWGEHAFWHLTEDDVGSSTDGAAVHDHLRQAPLWLWERLGAFDPGCVERFADGLDYHWIDEDRSEYNRHAPIEERERPSRGSGACDFPRYSGMYIFDWACAYAQTQKEAYLDQIEAMTDYWWEKREDIGLLAFASRGRSGIIAVGQTLGLAASLLESADVLDPFDPELAAEMRRRAETYVDGFMRAPHDPKHGIFMLRNGRGGLPYTNRSAVSPVPNQRMPTWESGRYIWPAASGGLHCLCAYRRTGDDRLLDFATDVARWQVRDPFPRSRRVLSFDAGLALGLFADLYDVTNDDRWLTDGLELAETMIDVYFDATLPRGAANVEWYESQMGTGFLLHGMTRLGLQRKYGTDCPLEADYTAR